MERERDQLTALVDLARVLTEASIPYALIGGIAVGIHSAVPRGTNDVDVAVATSVARETVVAALTGRGFNLRSEHAHSVNLAHGCGEPVRISWDEAFDEMILRAEEIEVSGEVVRTVTRDDLIASKERAARDPSRRKSKALRDQADVALLRGDTPDPDEGW